MNDLDTSTPALVENSIRHTIRRLGLTPEDLDRLKARCENRNVHLWSLPERNTMIAQHNSHCVACHIRPSQAPRQVTYRHNCEFGTGRSPMHCACGNINWKELA